MKLNQKQKRVLISIPIVFIFVAGIFPLFEWMIGAEQDAIYGAFRAGVSGAIGGSLLPILSLLFNWPMNLKD